MDIFSLQLDKTYYINYVNMSGYNIIRYMKFIIKTYMNSILEKINPTKNITELYKLNLFKYENTTYDYDEKIELFKKLYSGKLTTKDIEMFILHHNHLANYTIQQISHPTEDIIKNAFFVGNINFIEYLIDSKYLLSSKHLTYLMNINKSQLIKLIESINKYNVINYFENLDWYYHLERCAF